MARRILTYCAVFLSIVAISACFRENQCNVPIGMTNFSVDPNSAHDYGLNNVGGYMYYTGGHRGVVVIRTAYNQFVAYERTCPADSTSAVMISDEYGSSLLECPTCHTLFIVEADGMPMDGGATACPLYQYSTSYSDGLLWVY